MENDSSYFCILLVPWCAVGLQIFTGAWIFADRFSDSLCLKHFQTAHSTYFQWCAILAPKDFSNESFWRSSSSLWPPKLMLQYSGNVTRSIACMKESEGVWTGPGPVGPGRFLIGSHLSHPRFPRLLDDYQFSRGWVNLNSRAQLRWCSPVTYCRFCSWTCQKTEKIGHWKDRWPTK